MKKFSFSSFEDFPVSNTDKTKLKQVIKRLDVKKNTVVIPQGEVSQNIFFLRSGLVKLNYLTENGKEFIKSFIHEGNMFGSLHSIMTGGASTFGAVALEDLDLEVMNYSLFQEFVKNSPQFQQFALSFFQQLALKKELREYEFLCLSAQQRYERLRQQQPALVDRIKQADLALYLGITPIALSRMKHRPKQSN